MNWANYYKEKYEGEYRFYDYIQLKEVLKQKLFFKKKLKQKTSSVLQNFLSFLDKKLSPYLDQNTLRDIAKKINNLALIAEGIEISFRRLLTNTRPELIFIEDANYGNIDTCTIIKIAKELNIKTAVAISIIHLAIYIAKFHPLHRCQKWKLCTTNSFCDTKGFYW